MRRLANEHSAVLGLVFAVLVLAAASCGEARAALVEYRFEDLVDRSEFILRGKVRAITSFRGAFGRAGQVVMSDVVIEITELWKGEISALAEVEPAPNAEGSDPPAAGADGETAARTITIRLLGGRIGERRQICPDSPDYEVGEDVLVFARRWNGAWWTTGWLQGKYRVTADAGGIESITGKEGSPLARGARLSDVVAAVTSRLAGSGTTGSSSPSGSDRSGGPGSRDSRASGSSPGRAGASPRGGR